MFMFYVLHYDLHIFPQADSKNLETKKQTRFGYKKMISFFAQNIDAFLHLVVVG